MVSKDKKRRADVHLTTIGEIIIDKVGLLLLQLPFGIRLD